MSDDHNKMLGAEVFSSIHAESVEDFLTNQSALLALMDYVEDGVTLSTPDLDLIYVNRAIKRWYHLDHFIPGEKCYRVLHRRDSICENCPAIASMESGKAQTIVMDAPGNGSICETMYMHKYCITDSKGEIILIIGYDRDITPEKRLESQVQELQEEFELLKEKNDLLLQSMQMQKLQYDEMSQNLQQNIDQYVRPSLEYLKKKVDDNDLDMVASIIDHVAYPVTRRRSSALALLSPREMQVAAMIRDGFSSKEMADKLCVTKKAIDAHRSHIRSKLGLARDENLQTWLEMNL